MADDRTWTIRGRALHPGQLYELSMAWGPVGGVLLADLRKWAVAANLDEAQEPRTEREWRELATVLDRWVRSPEGRAYAGDDRGPALWEEHLAGFEAVDREAARLRDDPRFAALRTASPGAAQTLSALADLHPWVAWMQTTNRAFPTDVVPRLFVRELGIFAHTHQHHPT